MPIDLQSPDWLAALLEEESGHHDAASVRERLGELSPSDPGPASPVDLEPAARLLVARSLRLHRLDVGARTPDEAFLETARGHVALALDLAALAPRPQSPARAAASAIGFLAAALGEGDLALDLNPSREGEIPPRFIRRAERAAGRELLARFHPPGDPTGGLALYPGQLAVLRRHLARVGMGLHRHGELRGDGLERHRAFAERELVFLAEALAGCAASASPPTDDELA
ncbi:MAG TPA: hypothetical protein VLT61_06260, partial [Anaeromyxobacteraceae bacterium]|nr:hypothetical protein [Anaeromyxobacteraceae bacterium]